MCTTITSSSECHRYVAYAYSPHVRTQCRDCSRDNWGDRPKFRRGEWQPEDVIELMLSSDTNASNSDNMDL